MFVSLWRTGALALAALLPFAAAACSPTYTIRSGDTLSAIARDQLGSLFEFERIHAANRDVIGDDPNLIFPGDVLTIPCDFNVTEELDWSVMPSPAAIAAIMAEAEVQVVDIRSAGRVADGVVPGAVAVPYGRWRGPDDNPGAAPAEAELAAVIGAAGLDLAAPILIVHADDTVMATGRAARIYWLLK
ncbi:MAG: LysM peptidoglycan-binding domain-containing protein, partial [Pseudomonadota bacterium]